MADGIPQDKAAAISIGLEGILYGEYRKLVHPSQVNERWVVVFQAFHSSCLSVLCGR
jgi:hypothetical protein